MGLAGYEQEAHRFALGRDGHLIAVVEEHRSPVVDVGIALHVEIVLAQGIVGKGVLLIAEDALAPDHVGKDRVAARGLVDELGKGRKRNIEIFRLDDDVPDRSLLALHGPADDLDLRAALRHDLRHLRALDITVPGCHHLVGSGKVGPELKSLHDPVVVSLRHLLMDDAASRGHPLHVSRRDDALVAHAVAVLHIALEHVRYRLNAAMRVPGKPLDVLIGIGVAEIVEHQEGVEERDLAVAERPV